MELHIDIIQPYQSEISNYMYSSIPINKYFVFEIWTVTGQHYFFYIMGRAALYPINAREI